jgi:hypothetical protein
MREVKRYYSFKKAMGPDRVTEKGMRARNYHEVLDIKDFMEGKLDLRDMRKDLILLPKVEEEAHINKHRPIAIMPYRNKAKNQAFVK